MRQTAEFISEYDMDVFVALLYNCIGNIEYEYYIYKYVCSTYVRCRGILILILLVRYSHKNHCHGPCNGARLEDFLGCQYIFVSSR